MKNKKTYNEIKSAIPDLESEKVEVYADELDRILSIKRLFTSEDGKVLLGELRDECASLINQLTVSYKKNPNINELISIIANLDSKLSILMKVQDISMEEELRVQLDEAVKEAFKG
jgi:hypothetical protein